MMPAKEQNFLQKYNLNIWFYYKSILLHSLKLKVTSTLFKAIVENAHTNDKKNPHFMPLYGTLLSHMQLLNVAGGSFKSLLVSRCRFHVLLDV